MRNGAPFLQRERIPFRNDSGETIPAYGIIKITGTVEVDGRIVFKAEKPDTYGSQYMHWINGPTPVASGSNKYGVCFHPASPTWVKYATGDGTPAFGESWGPVDSSWELKKHVGGFQILGAHEDGRVLVVQSPLLIAFGKTDSSLAKDSAGTISIWHGTTGSETDSTHNFENVRNDYASLDSGKKVEMRWNAHDQKWRLIAGEC